MKYIKLFENFKSEIDKVENDIRGILIDLEDKGFVIYTSIQMNNITSYIDIVISSRRDNFKYKEISEYIFTLIDYVKYLYKDDRIVYNSNTRTVFNTLLSSNKLDINGYSLKQRKRFSIRIPNEEDEICDFSIKFMQHHDT